MFRNGKAYESVSASFLDTFSQDIKEELVGVYVESLKYVWRLSVIFAGLAFFLVFVEKQIKMRTELDTEFGINDGKKTEKDSEPGTKVSKWMEATDID